MNTKHEFHPEFSKLPATGFRARELGEILYFTGKRCVKNHLSTRYASSGNCVECIAMSRGKVSINFKGKSSKRSDANQIAAMSALENGHLEYAPDEPCPKGHYRRYVSTNNCIDCNAETAANRSEKIRWARIKKLYGLSASEVSQMLGAQNNKCEICKEWISLNYHIDHCHSTGKVRGLLCQKCNQAIGLLHENQSLFKRAAEYIGKHDGIA
jgi:hypothetical protein